MADISRKFKIFLFLFVLVLFSVTVGLAIFSASLPDIIKPTEYKPMIVSEVYADGGTKIGEFFELRRKAIELKRIPKHLIHAFIASEDAQFFSHKGIDIRGIIRAAIKNFKAGRVVQGGSTITQQVARSLLLTREKKISRKIKEVILAMRLEKELSKEEILYLYLNEIYLGHGAYGVQAASQNYFGKNVWEIDLAEAAIMAGLPQAPSRYSPLLSRRLAKERQIYVLGRMLEDGYISKKEALLARDQVLTFLKRQDLNLKYAPYFVEHVRRYLIDKYGFEKVLQDGLQVHTTLNVEDQMAANLAIDMGLRDVDKRQGYRGELKHLSEEEMEAYLKQVEEESAFEEGEIYEVLVTEVNDDARRVIVRWGATEGEIPFEEMRWAREPNPDKYYLEELIQKPSEALEVGDIILVRVIEKKEGEKWHVNLEQEPVVQGALLSFEHENGFVRSMVGGFDFSKSEFNRAVQGKRQVGSTFKPVIYAAAIERGQTPATMVVDSPIIYQEGEKEAVEKWKPRNYAEKFYGDTPLANGLAFSRNIVTIKIAQEVSIEYIVDFAKRLGVQSDLIEDLSMALGSSSLTLEEMCKVFAVFARQGKPTELVFIKKVVDREGNVLEEYEAPAEQEQVISPQLAYLMTYLLKRVVNIGTGKKVKDLNWPLAGKTGTTSDYADAWFLGYSPHLLTGVWVGFDERKKIGEHEAGSKAAIPIWKTYMKTALTHYKKRDFAIPPAIVFTSIDPQTGKLSSSKTQYPTSLAFIEGTEPKEEQDIEGAQKKVLDEEEFFKEDL